MKSEVLALRPAAKACDTYIPRTDSVIWRVRDFSGENELLGEGESESVAWESALHSLKNDTRPLVGGCEWFSSDDWTEGMGAD